MMTRPIGITALALLFGTPAFGEKIALGRYVAEVRTQGARQGPMSLSIEGQEICRGAGDVHVLTQGKRYSASHNAQTSVKALPDGTSVVWSNRVEEIGFQCRVEWTCEPHKLKCVVTYKFDRDSKGSVELRLGAYGNAPFAGCKYDVVTKSIEYHDVMPETLESKRWQKLIGKFKSVELHTSLGPIELRSSSVRRGLYPTLYLTPSPCPENVPLIVSDRGVGKGRFRAGYENTVELEIVVH